MHLQVKNLKEGIKEIIFNAVQQAVQADKLTKLTKQSKNIL